MGVDQLIYFDPTWAAMGIVPKTLKAVLTEMGVSEEDLDDLIMEIIAILMIGIRLTYRLRCRLHESDKPANAGRPST